MIGKICISTTPYYDNMTHKQRFKKRPVLIIGQADSSDYNVLPISRVTNSKNLDPNYDIKVDPIVYPNLKLNALSYIRVHKQTVLNYASLNSIADLKYDYPQLFQKVIDKLKEYNNELYKLVI